jgi:hypothetical protein
MKVSDVRHGNITTVEIRRMSRDRLPEGLAQKAEGTLTFAERGETRLSVGDDTWPIEGCRTADNAALRLLANRALPHMAWVIQRVPPQGPVDRVVLQVHEFPVAHAWTEAFEIGIDEKTVDDMRRRRQSLVSVETVQQWMSDTFLLPPRRPGGNHRVLLSGPPRSADPGRSSAFRLHGKDHAVDVEPDSDDKLRIVRVVQERRQFEGTEERPLFLVTGRFSFCDWTQAGRFRGAHRTELDAAVAGDNSYLDLWREYNARERAAILRRAQQFKWVKYDGVATRGDGSRAFRLAVDTADMADLLRRLDDLEEDTLEAGAEVPPAIQGMEEPTDRKNRKRPFVGAVVERPAASSPWIALRPDLQREDRDPPEKGFLFVPLGGTEVRIQRRTESWEKIRNCANPMPAVGHLIEGLPIRTRQTRELRPLTCAVREVIREPNERQQEALRVALNTPDIALIQGPPGTGKTRVIAALEARLAESDECVDPTGISGSTLLTSYQHDAVENAAAETRVLGLPAVKVGHRQGADDDTDPLDVWIADTAFRARAARSPRDDPDSVHVALRRVRERVAPYVGAPGTDDDVGGMLSEIARIAGPWIPGDLAADVVLLGARLGHGAEAIEDPDREFALKAVRGLRTESVSFLDDGPANAHKALRRMSRLPGFTLADAESECLELAASQEPGTAPQDLLVRLAAVRDGLLDRLAPPRADTRPSVHVDVETLLVKVVDALDRKARESAAGVDLAVDEWLSDLEHDPDGVRDAIGHYTMVLAATCQQSVSRDMEEMKLGRDTVFRSVIVDEAARANPLDLLIPLARAERRIVLVGDHRQLPHLLEPDIEREMEGSVRDGMADAFRKSLFERLFVELREREARDGIRRTVTLNVQYRMHPALGQFVSEQFYEKHGEGFTSVRPESDFAHGCSLRGADLSGKVAAWIDVPIGRGQEESRGRSKARRAEARTAAGVAEEILKGSTNLSVGVITFYAAQRDVILEEMASLDLAEPRDGGGFRIRDAWRRTLDGRERLRVGTVDAFQGKQFDVVLLSLTRSNRVNVKDEATRRQRFGFLLLENRLCVAMSRQHRLLAIIGDPEMAAGPDALESVPALVAFRSLCEGLNGTVIRKG